MEERDDEVEHGKVVVDGREELVQGGEVEGFGLRRGAFVHLGLDRVKSPGVDLGVCCFV